MPNDSLTQNVRTINNYRKASARDRRGRMLMSRQNWEAFHGKQDWSHKTPTQSAEFMPRVSRTTHRIAATIKRSLIQPSDWFSAEIGTKIIEPQTVEKIIGCFLDNLALPDGGLQKFPVLVEDAVKVGLLSSLMIAKVVGRTKTQLNFNAERGRELFDIQDGDFEFADNDPVLSVSEEEIWHLAVDLINPRHYYPDPTGRKLFEIHRVFRDISEVKELAGEGGIYDANAVDQIENTSPNLEERQRKAEEAGKDVAEIHPDRFEVVIDEFWGTLLNDEGEVVEKNVVAAVANEKFEIRKPEPNPFWHQESPFAVSPLMRIPFDVWHRAFMDDATPLNKTLNELMSLILDGGVREALGVTEVDTDAMFDARQVSGGVMPGDSLARKPGIPINQKIITHEELGKVPAGTIQVYGMVDGEFKQATLTNDLTFGQIPGKEVLATEIADARNESNDFFASLVQSIELDWITTILTKGWKVILQHQESFNTKMFQGLINHKDLVQLEEMSKEERFVHLSQECVFKVRGISANLERAQDLQRLMTVMQLVGRRDSVLSQVWAKKFSYEKMFSRILRALRLDPDDLRLDEEGDEGQEEVMQAFLQAVNKGQGDRQAGNGKAVPVNGNSGDSPFQPEEDFALAGGTQV
tara:strand:- start:5027 stop:6940 length:1914 start_codon:yes stop_codon:yes gene_type:complete